MNSVITLLREAFARQRIARAAAGLLVLAGAAFAQYKLANVPEPVEVETIKELSPATVRLGQEELIIEGPVVDAEQGMLFSHNGRPNETVDVRFDRARLGKETLESFQRLRASPPSTAAAINYRPMKSKSADGHEPCRTRIDLFSFSKMPEEIHLFQYGDPGQNYHRHIEMTAKGAELVSGILTASPDESALAPGCQYSLDVGEWSEPIGRVQVTIVMNDNSTVRLYFRPRTPGTNPWAETKGVLPLDLGAQKLKSTDAQPFQAHGVRIKPLGGGDSASDLVSATSLNDGPLLNIRGLMIGSDELQLSVSGKGWVATGGKIKTVNLFSLIEQNKIISAILGAANAALLAWVGRLVFKNPSTPLQPRRLQVRSRNIQRRRRTRTED